MTPRYKIGQEFIQRKTGRMSRVIDIYTTYNAAGEIVNTEYTAENEFCGQKVKFSTCEAAITIALEKAKQDEIIRKYA